MSKKFDSFLKEDVERIDEVGIRDAISQGVGGIIAGGFDKLKSKLFPQPGASAQAIGAEVAIAKRDYGAVIGAITKSAPKSFPALKTALDGVNGKFVKGFVGYVGNQATLLLPMINACAKEAMDATQKSPLVVVSNGKTIPARPEQVAIELVMTMLEMQMATVLQKVAQEQAKIDAQQAQTQQAQGQEQQATGTPPAGEAQATGTPAPAGGQAQAQPK